jgi:hypothetical protein
MSISTRNTVECLADVRNSTDGVDRLDVADVIDKSIPMEPIAASGPTPVSMASAEQVMTLQSDGNFVVTGSRKCCPDGSADDAIWDIGGKRGRNTLEYRPVFADNPPIGILAVHRPLGSTYSPLCFIDVENEVFEFDGQEIVFDNSANQLTAKAPGGM